MGFGNLKKVKTKYKVICPLFSFQIPLVLMGPHEMSPDEVKNWFEERRKEITEGIELLEGLKLRTISEEDLEDFRTNPFLKAEGIRFSSRMFVLEKCIALKTSDHRFQVDELMKDTVLALRLLRNGYVTGNWIFYISITDKRLLGGWSNYGTRKLNLIALDYALNFDEVPVLREILGKIRNIDIANQKSLRLACERFQRVYEEEEYDDKLIDLMIAFEALFLKGKKAKSRSPAGETIAIACAYLLGKNNEERENIKDFLTKAYSIRNDIVHGSDYKNPIVNGEEYEMLDFVSEIEELLRRSIKRLLD